MNIDKIDKQIFECFIRKKDKELTTSDVAKEIFPIDNKYELIKKTSMIDYRIKKWKEIGLIIKKKNRKKNYFRLDKRRVHYGKGELKVNGVNINMGKVIALDIGDGGYYISFIESL